MKILTFYSFKGGVGRTALMMHLAVQWADSGKVVAVVDMDLNAPGVSYSPRLRHHPDPTLQNRGVSDLLATFYDVLDEENFGFYPPSKLLREMTSHEPGGMWGSQGRLLVLPAGSVNLPRMLPFEDAKLHRIPAREPGSDEPSTQKALRAFARMFLEDQKYRPAGLDRGIDYLLIDCRTGYPDVVDLTLGYLADRIILVTGLNQQNLHGLKLTLDALRPQRVKPGFFASDLLVIFSPVPVHVHDQPEARKAIQEGITILNNSRFPADGASQPELIPPLFALPYTPHLASSDLPIQREFVLGKLHPYWVVVNEIAKTLVPDISVVEFQQPPRMDTPPSPLLARPLWPPYCASPNGIGPWTRSKSRRNWQNFPSTAHWKTSGINSWMAFVER